MTDFITIGKGSKRRPEDRKAIDANWPSFSAKLVCAKCGHEKANPDCVQCHP